MGTYSIKMPDIGEGIAEVELVAWRVQPGDEVAEDQVLADVMTDKATVEIPSPVQGRVQALGGEPGQVLAVGAELIRLEVAGEGNGKGEAAEAVPAGREEATLAADATAAPAHVPPAETQVRQPLHVPVQEPAARAPGDRPIASPAVRRRAWELGIELSFVHGSGPAGRILHEDLDVYQASRGQPPRKERPSGSRQRQGDEAVPVTGLRRRIAQKMQEAHRRIPHFSYVEEVDVTELEALRAQLNERYAATRGKLTLLPFICRAVVRAVEEFPQVNARFDDEAGEAGVVTRFQPVHLGIATQTEAGLMVPVVRHAEAQGLWGLAGEIARLAKAARSGKASREELGGSTLSITSLGPLGGIASTPVINHPEVAIVGVNRVVQRPMFQGAAVVPRLLMNLSSSFDHRVVDGMDAARFIQAVRGLLERPALLLVG
ncbi:2-oxo acid dehydrogenase subunit E2 [Ramlibacter sp. AW1]|uniref:Dihydrolipoamide acetyltransferase component of pyruvate dehydrogenase complex n=1 Tax=Ramlibacter aurantiacus TaxID=2801330 RepID=A0A936ZJC8_9BURK|nr:dihydrolipoamide acetyltransferase family protein [Ramlibacter aurantiacus]MBL0421977.1 2-oxo acid dehydrogenase subunit E2 [Ramlibacter aurantiacus]